MLCLPAKSVEELPGDGSPGGGELHGAVGPVSVRPHDGPVHADFLLVPDLTWPEILCDAMDRLSCSSGINPTETFGRRCVSVHLTLPNRATDRSLLMPSSRSGRRAPWTKLQKVPLKTNNHFISKLGVFGQSASRSVNRLLKNPVLRPTFNQVVLCCVFSALYLSVFLSLSEIPPL